MISQHGGRSLSCRSLTTSSPESAPPTRAGGSPRGSAEAPTVADGSSGGSAGAPPGLSPFSPPATGRRRFDDAGHRSTPVRRRRRSFTGSQQNAPGGLRDSRSVITLLMNDSAGANAGRHRHHIHPTPTAATSARRTKRTPARPSNIGRRAATGAPNDRSEPHRPVESNEPESIVACHESDASASSRSRDVRPTRRDTAPNRSRTAARIDSGCDVPEWSSRQPTPRADVPSSPRLPRRPDRRHALTPDTPRSPVGPAAARAARRTRAAALLLDSGAGAAALRHPVRAQRRARAATGPGPVAAPGASRIPSDPRTTNADPSRSLQLSVPGGRAGTPPGGSALLSHPSFARPVPRSRTGPSPTRDQKK